MFFFFFCIFFSAGVGYDAYMQEIDFRYSAVQAPTSVADSLIRAESYRSKIYYVISIFFSAEDTANPLFRQFFGEIRP